MVFFELQYVAVLDLPHEGFALEEVALEIAESWRARQRFGLEHFGKRNGTARGMNVSPLEDETVFMQPGEK